MVDTAVSTEVVTEQRPSGAGQVPGEPGLWLFILGEATMFTALFVSYVYSRSKHLEQFRSSQRALNVGSGVAATVLLLTSSLCLALAVRAMRAGTRRHTGPLIAAALACGLGFAALKVGEYSSLANAHLAPSTNSFYMNYYLLTGIHLLHLTIGMALLAHLWLFSRRPKLTDRQLDYVEGCASYWHLVDLLWIVIFPLLYLVR